MPPAAPGREAKDPRGFFQVGGDGHGAGDDVEEDVPLGAEKHDEHGGDFETATQADQEKQNDRKKSGGRNGGGDLRERLRDASEAGVGAGGAADGGGPKGGEGQGGATAAEVPGGA